jgi:hypothetical protein
MFFICSNECILYSGIKGNLNYLMGVKSKHLFAT